MKLSIYVVGFGKEFARDERLHDIYFAFAFSAYIMKSYVLNNLKFDKIVTSLEAILLKELQAPKGICIGSVKM